MKSGFMAKQQHILAFVLFFCLLIGLYYPLLSVQGFSPKDDWASMVIASSTPMHFQIQTQTAAYSSLRSLIHDDMERAGRFRPAYWVFTYIEAHIFVSHAWLWQLETLLSGLIAVWLLYYACRQLQCGFLPALWVSTWFIVAGTGLWKEKQIAEEQGVVVLLIALNLIILAGRSGETTSRWDWVGLTLLTLAGLIKESFTLVIPATIGLRVALAWYGSNYTGAAKDGNRNFWSVILSLRWLIAAGILVTVLLLLPVVYVYRLGGYGRSTSGEMTTNRFVDIASWWAWAQSAREKLLYFVPLISLLGSVTQIRTAKQRWLFLLGTGVFLAWIWPQIFLYAGAHYVDHYVFPAALGLMVITGIGLTLLQRFTPRILFSLVYGLFTVVLIYTVASAWNNIQSQAAQINAFQRIIDATTTHADDDDAILVFSDVWWDREITFLVELSLRDIQSAAYVAYQSDRIVGAAPRNHVKLTNSIYRPFSAVDADEIDLIVSYVSADRFRTYAAQHFEWFDENEWNEQRITTGYQLASWRSLLGISDIETSRSVEYALFYR